MGSFVVSVRAGYLPSPSLDVSTAFGTATVSTTGISKHSSKMLFRTRIPVSLQCCLPTEGTFQSFHGLLPLVISHSLVASDSWVIYLGKRLINKTGVNWIVITLCVHFKMVRKQTNTNRHLRTHVSSNKCRNGSQTAWKPFCVIKSGRFQVTNNNEVLLSGSIPEQIG